MKNLKIFLFILVAFLFVNVSLVNAETSSANVTVDVIPEVTLTPTASLTADSTSIPYNTGTTLHISSTNATYCELFYPSGGNNTKGPSWDYNTGNLTTTSTYSLTCGNATLTATDSVTITVPSVCPAPTSQTVTVACDVNAAGDSATSGIVTRKQTKVFPGCTFGSPVTSSNSTYVSDTCVYPPSTCSSPTSQTVTVACGLNASGDSAISGVVTRKQTKVYPSCNFGSPVTSSNSSYVSDTCVYPPSSCSAPLTQTVTVACDSRSGFDLVSGSVKRLQTKDSSSCTFGSPVTISNSSYVSDTCVYKVSPSSTCGNGAVNYPACTHTSGGTCIDGQIDYPACTTFGPKVNGYWTEWSPAVTTCPQTVNQTRSYVPAQNGGQDYATAPDGTSNKTQTITFNQCPSVLNMDVTFKGVSIKVGNKTSLIPYNSKVNVLWSSQNAPNGCKCSATDSAGTTSCGTTSPSASAFLKKNTTFMVTCEGQYGIKDSKSVQVLVDKIKAEVIEQ